MTEIKKYEFGYWPTMGLGQGARYLLAYQKTQNPDLNFVIKDYTFENFNEFVSGVAFPNLSKESIIEICEKFKIYTRVIS